MKFSFLMKKFLDNRFLFKLPCWLVEDCLVDLSKENYSEYDNYLIIQKIVSLIKEYVFNLIEYENSLFNYKF